jgi:hypothetical protein
VNDVQRSLGTQPIGVFWFDVHASGVQAVATVVTTLLTLVLAFATVMYVRESQKLSRATERAVESSKQLVADQQLARQLEHAAAVEAVFHELVAIADPLRLVLEHGNLALRVPFTLFATYRQVLGPFYLGLPPDLGRKVARTYSFLDIQRTAFESMTVIVLQLKLVFNEELATTIAYLRSHLHDLGRDIPAGPGPIDDGDVHLTQQMVQAAHESMGDQA